MSNNETSQKATVAELMAMLKPERDSKGVEWLVGWLPPSALQKGSFRPVKPDRVRELLPIIGEQGQKITALGWFDDLVGIIEQGRHRKRVAELLGVPLMVRMLRKADATAEQLAAMRATVEESNEKLDEISAIKEIKATMARDGVSQTVAARMHNIPDSKVSRIAYYLDADPTFQEIVESRSLTMEQIALLKKIPDNQRVHYAERLIGKGLPEGTRPLTTKELKAQLATPKNDHSKKKELRVKGNGWSLILTYDADKAPPLPPRSKNSVAPKREATHDPSRTVHGLSVGISH